MRQRLVAITVLAATALGCSSAGPATTGTASGAVSATAPPPTTLDPPPTGSGAASADEDPIAPQGFERVAATVTKADGETCEVCLWLADTPERRVRGLMNVTDLGNADGMAFVYPLPRTGNFWMKDTLLPLSIAFFDLGGGYLGEFDMEPCTSTPCPRYRTARDFVIAVETNRGELAEIGIGPGSSIELSDLPCGP